MSEKRKILIHLDTDIHASVFDRVVAVDSGIDFLFTHSGVRPEHVVPMVHGAIFTRGNKDLHRTAIFLGGSDVAHGEAVLKAVQQAMIPKAGLQVSTMLDSNGCNTTAVAAVLAAEQHLKLSTTTALVLGGTGPVGQRVARILARQGSKVLVGSRDLSKAQQACDAILRKVPTGKVTAVATASSSDAPLALQQAQLVVAAGAAGVVLLPEKMRKDYKNLKVVIDLNAVPPVGIEGVDPMDRGQERDGAICYGAIGVGNTKMKIHRLAVAKLFEANNTHLDAEEIYDLGKSLGKL
ncbi:MAG: methylene-tetrahydromethanopterin dehydrogenase N-terminal domain-containing protein [Zavarzinella sp.]